MSDVDEHLDLTEINAVRRLLTSKPRPVDWDERRARLDEVGSVWPIADDIRCEDAVLDGLEGEWSLAPESDRDKVLLFFHGGGYCSGSLQVIVEWSPRQVEQWECAPSRSTIDAHRNILSLRNMKTHLPHGAF